MAARNGVSPPQRGDAAGTRKASAFGKCTSSSLPPTSESSRSRSAREIALGVFPSMKLAANAVSIAALAFHDGGER